MASTRMKSRGHAKPLKPGRVSPRKRHSHRTQNKKSPTYNAFLRGDVTPVQKFSFLSLFSGAGIGDFGLKLAGGVCVGACEIDAHRRAVHKANVNGLHQWEDVRTSVDSIVNTLKNEPPDLIIATPPCQSFSTANARRGDRENLDHANRDSRTHLFLDAIRIIRRLRPRVVVFENVPNFLDRTVSDGKTTDTVRAFLDRGLKGYLSVTHVVCFSTLGLPQRRKRALAIYIRDDTRGCRELIEQLKDVSSWQGKIIRTPKTVSNALARLPALDGQNEALARSSSDPLHSVPTYSPTHYSWIKAIPSGSGGSAWGNACEACGARPKAMRECHCWQCGSAVRLRPHVEDRNGIRAIRGYKTSYRRMRTDEIAPTVTTSSGHFSSDIKLHPTENRVLSARECAVLQSIPLPFDWPQKQRFKNNYLVREMIGEAVPPLVTYRLAATIASAFREEK